MLEPYADRFKGGTVLDLGCGTGLMGQYLRDNAAQLIGIDLSAAMLEEARNKQIYDALVEGDIVEYCRRLCAPSCAGHRRRCAGLYRRSAPVI